jgi:hypothetical protein
MKNLRVCAGSGDLFGLIGYGGAAASYEQRCYWTKCPYRDEAWHRPQSALREPPGDFPAKLELCYCCAAEVIPSGSKFSSFFCEECRAAVHQANIELGRVVIPLGRHSLMNGIALRGGTNCDSSRIAGFADAVNWSFNRIDRLFMWHRGVVSDRVAAMADSARLVAADAYLTYAASYDVTKAEMFGQLCRYFGIGAPLAGRSSRARRADDA